MNTKKRVALITGASSGIGQEVAKVLAAQGVSVALIGRNLEGLRNTESSIERTNGNALSIIADITKENEVKDAIRQIINAFGKIDIAVNCAGVLKLGPIDEMSYESFFNTFEINTLGTWLSIKHEISEMKKSGGGSIINIASNIGIHVTRPGTSAYAASKAAVAVMTRIAAVEAIGHGIRINCISPGPVDTAMSYRPGETLADRNNRVREANPSKRVATTSEIASAVLWLVSKDAEYIVGQDIVIDGGASA